MINKLVEQADQLAARGQREQARDLYVRVCQLAPHRCRYWLRLAELQNDLDQVGDCLKALEYALRLEPRNRDALLLAAGVLQKAGDFEQAVQRADQVLDLEGGNRLAALLNKGTALLPMARYAEALAAADAALNIDPRQPVAHSTRGSALFGLGRLEEAQAAFDQALTLRPGHGLVLINRAAVLRALRRPAEALADVDAALAVQPDFPAALLNRAAALMDLERYAEALATLDRLLARHPNHVKALRNRGLALIQMGRYPAAMTTVQSLQALGQSVVEIVLSASKALLGQTQPAQALAWIDQALVWHPDHPELLRARIAVLLAQEHYRTAPGRLSFHGKARLVSQGASGQGGF